jgi:N-acyl-D-amino-acid deacylase
MEFELVVNNGLVVDGTGAPRYRAHLGIEKGRIVAISRDQPLAGRTELDATGLVVAPGFVDVHSHSDWILPLADHDEILTPLVMQGITTVVAGQCGFSPAPATEEVAPLLDGFSEMLRERAFAYTWRTMSDFLDVLESQGVLLNTALLVGHGTLRYLAMGRRSGTPTERELAAMALQVGQALEGGAWGFSAGLAYAPGVFAGNPELLSLLRVVADRAALFAVHGRAYSWVSPLYRPMIGGTAHNLRSVRELLGLARASGVKLQLSHQIFVGRRTWRTHRAVLREIETAAASGVDVAMDAFPYTVGNSTINVVFPDWFLDDFERQVDDPGSLRRLKREMDVLRLGLGLDYRDITLLWARRPELAELEGLDFAAIGRRLRQPPFEAYMHVARASQGRARVLLGTYSGDGAREEPLRAVLAHPLCAFMTDTILTDQGVHNPASFGTFPRVLGRYSRELGLFTLEEAVRRMTSWPAARLGLADMGGVATGHWADLVLFDPETVADHTTPDRPDAPPSGIHAVLISGRVVARDGKVEQNGRCGRVLRR